MSADGSPSIRTKYPELFQSLCDPFGKEDIKHRSCGGGRKLSYITARTAMNRLDKVLGPENWWDEYEAHENSVLCRLTIRLPDGRLLTKCDAGGYAGMADAGDDDKSGYSDAFKRACVKFGVARHLYNDGIPEFADEQSAPTQNVLGQPAATPPIHAPEKPHNGRAFWSWLKEQGDRAKVDLLRYIESWGKLQKFPSRFVEWTGDQVSRGMAEAIHYLGTLPPPQQSEPIETQLFEPLPNPPRTGKALYKAVKELQDEHQITLLKEVNDWAAKEHRHKGKMVDWPESFIEQAWLYVSSLVAKHTGQRPSVNAEPSANGPASHPDHNGNPSSVKALRDEFWGWCEGCAMHVYNVTDGSPIDKAKVIAECNVVAGLLTPGRTIATFADLTDADDLRRLAAKAHDRFRELADAKRLRF
jgi:hypothetical protein